MRLKWILPVLVLACGGDETIDSTAAAESSGAPSETSTSAASSTGAPESSESGGTDAGTTAGGSSSSDGSSTSDGSSEEDASSSEGESSTGAAIPEGCAGIEPIELLDPWVMPVGGASWVPGGSVTIGVTMYNPGPDFLSYPSIVVESDDPLVTSGAPGNQLFGILTDQSYELTVEFAADRAVARGTEVTFTIHMATLDTICPNGASVEVQATVE